MASASSTLKYVLFLGIGIGIGVPGGFVLNDLVEQENPQTMEELCADYRTQENLDNLFEDLERRQQQ